MRPDCFRTREALARRAELLAFPPGRATRRPSWHLTASTVVFHPEESVHNKPSLMKEWVMENGERQASVATGPILLMKLSL